MKFGDFFRREWECENSMTGPCGGPNACPNDPLHVRCGWRYVANINEYDYESLKDARLIK